MLGKSCGNIFPEFLRWGCREHFVSGCWHSSGRDRGRYPRECWLSTLGVLHPGVPVMWYGHIRDLFPTVEGCKGSRLPQCNNVALGTANVMFWCHVSDGSVNGGWLGRVCTTLHLHAPYIHPHSTSASFVSLPPLALQLARCPLQPGMLPALTHVVRDAFCEGDEGIAEGPGTAQVSSHSFCCKGLQR